jgi:hypothetical protein
MFPIVQMGFLCYKVKGLFSNLFDVRYPQTQLVFPMMKTSRFIYLNNEHDILKYSVVYVKLDSRDHIILFLTILDLMVMFILASNTS